MDSIRQSRIERDADGVLHKVDDLLQSVGEASANRLGGLRDRVNQAASSVRSKVVDLDADVRDRARYAARATDDYVHNNPWRVIGLSALVGVAVGLIVSRMDRR